MSSQGHRTHGRNATDLDGNYTSGINPFDNDRNDLFNPEFSQMGGRGVKTYKDEARQPMLSGVDMDVQRPSAVGHRAKTVGAFAPASSSKTSKNFFSFKASGGSNDVTGGFNPTESIYQEEKKSAAVADRNTPIVIGKRKIAIWPYDDYHLVQKLYYEKLQENALESQIQHQFPPNSQQKKQQAAKEAEKAAAAAARQRDQSLPIFSRPADPVDIPTAVQGLSLNQFEEKAKDRAISIISTWLFDAELIDELLVNGGMSATIMASTADKHRDKLDGTSMDESERSVKTSEGIEIGSHGYPLEGSNKMDKEIAKLRNATKRQLALINARLNDGVVATGAEVQELVNAVITTKDDIGRLRELSTYVSNNQDVEKTSNFMLTRYPKLKQAINARRNIARVFRELEFFAMIPGTCDRLREELHAGEWTAHEWNSLRTVTREHCDLEIFLVEAELEMKKRLEEEEQQQQLNQMMNMTLEADLHGGDRSRFTKQSMRGFGTTAKQATLVDRFLEEHVRNVWEMGEEIRIRIMSGISSAFELAMNNPAGMVALVEAVERYEFANEEYMAVYGSRAGTQKNAKLRFTDMRAAALAELYKDLESRCFEVFQELTANAADILSSEDDDDVINKQFSSVLRAAHDLSGEIITVKDRMAPCFPPNWQVASLWTTCVAHVCCNNILLQIGGPEGQKLPDLTVTQMLDLVAWVENFREILLEIFPDLDKIAAPKQIYLNKPPRLVAENSRTIDLKLAEDSLVWVNTTLWSVHDLAKDEFLYRTKEQTEEWLNNVYRDEHNKAQTSEGRLVTSLCEDVYSLAAVQVRTIRERLTRRSEALVQAVGVVFKHLYEKQTTCRDLFCTDFETCCAAANDFLRMSEKCEEIINEIKNESKLSDAANEMLDEQAAALLTLYSGDAVYAAKKTHVYCFHPIEEAIANELFSAEWERELTHNELALTLVRTLDDFMEDLETFLDELMVIRAVEAQISSSVNFYIRCLLKKSSVHSGNKPVFTNIDLAIRRMRGDSQVMREYFDGLAESMPTLVKIVENEFSLLECIFELISIAAGLSKSDAQDFILILQKRVKNIYITKLVVGDLWHLVNPAEERDIYEAIDGMEDTLNAVAPIDEKAIAAALDRSTVPGLRMDETMARHAEVDKRRRPMKSEAIEKAQIALKSWGWGRKKDGEEGKMTSALAAATTQVAAAATQVAAAATAVRSSVITRPAPVQTNFNNGATSPIPQGTGSGSSKPKTPTSGYSPSPRATPRVPTAGKSPRAKPKPPPVEYEYDGPAEF